MHLRSSRCSRFGVVTAAAVVGVVGCSVKTPPLEPEQRASLPFTVTAVTDFDEPWAMTFLPDGRALITERTGALLVVDVATGAKKPVAGVPRVVVDGQSGLGDVILAPSFAQDGRLYLSWVEAKEGAPSETGAVIGRATLKLGENPTLVGLERIWQQEPKTSGNGHFSHRMAISPDQQYLFVTSGERQKFTPAQDLSTNLGKVLRLTLDGKPASGNPFENRGGVSAQIWSYGHRNGLALAFDEHGNLWESEMGPKGGDEVNVILPGRNYGWPNVSNGSHYDGRDIPDHKPGDAYEPPIVWWNPSISPAGMIVYTGSSFPKWRGDLFVGALSGKALIRCRVNGTGATKADQWDFKARVREVEQGPDGAIWVLEDDKGARLLKLTPPR